MTASADHRIPTMTDTGAEPHCRVSPSLSNMALLKAIQRYDPSMGAPSPVCDCNHLRRAEETPMRQGVVGAGTQVTSGALARERHSDRIRVNPHRSNLAFIASSFERDSPGALTFDSTCRVTSSICRDHLRLPIPLLQN